MTRYLISFPSRAMDHIPGDEMPAVGEAAHAVIREAMDAGAWVFGGGLAEDVDPVLVAGGRDDHGRHVPAEQGAERRLRRRRRALTGGSRGVGGEDRGRLPLCAQEIREFMPDPEVGN